MSRLRIRIELNRGGVGVPLHKLASVVEEAQKFFHMLTEDVQIDQAKGEWLGFDFGNESLNFTAEFVGPVTADQVAAFHAAFDGTTSLRRATISQFARITDAIEQDELIGFGLYLNDEGNEPTEWRCLSRRDALRITEEIQVLIAASGEADRESHLPAVSANGAGARMFSDRRERGQEAAKWAAYVREVEANVDRRITRVEQALEDQSGMIEDLHVKSSSTEDSVRKLLTAVEGFCTQTTRQLEAITAPPAIAANAIAATAIAAPAPVAAPAAVEVVSPVVEAAPAAEPVMASAAIVEKIAEPEAAPVKPLEQQAPIQSEAKPSVQPEAKPQPQAQPPQTEAKPPLQPEAKPAQPEAKPQLQPEAKPAQPQGPLQPEAKPAQPETKPPLQPAAKPVQPIAQPPKPEVKPPFQPHTKPPLQPQVQPWTATPQTARKTPQFATAELGWTRKLDWRLAGGAALLVAGAIIIVGWAWQNLFSGPSVQRVAATSSAVTAPAPAVEPQPAVSSVEPKLPARSAPAPQALPTPKPTQAAAKSAGSASLSALQHITLEASEQTWVAAKETSGAQVLARVFEKGDTRTLDLSNGAIVRVGNAGGLRITLNGTSIGKIGAHGEVRNVVFKNGSYKVVPVN